ncbi:hypothetical protein Tco_1208013 [Tanacetum coccineum]
MGSGNSHVNVGIGCLCQKCLKTFPSRKILKLHSCELKLARRAKSSESSSDHIVNKSSEESSNHVMNKSSRESFGHVVNKSSEVSSDHVVNQSLKESSDHVVNMSSDV